MTKVETVHDLGTRAGQPTPTVDQVGTLYFVTDEFVLERWSGTAWVRIGSNPGADAGTSFPGGPSSGDRFYRTDHAEGFRYDGTRWLCDRPHVVMQSAGATTGDGLYAKTATVSSFFGNPAFGGLEIFVEKFGAGTITTGVTPDGLDRKSVV